VIAFYGLEGAVINMGSIPVYPRGFDPFGNDVVRAHSVKHNAKVCFSLMDAWVIKSESFQEIKWVPWYPVDSEPISRPVLESVSKAYRRIAMSKFGLEMTQNAGLDAYYVPHGIDTEVYKPYDQYENREKYGLPKDAYIVGMVAANKGFPSRKAFVPQIMAFAEFKKRHSDAVLYMHTFTCEHGEYDGVNLVEFCELAGLEVGKDVFFPNQYDMMMGFYQDKHMAELYSSFDVHMLVSMGEGFGIPILEAQACGCPVITSGWTANKELCFSGRTIDKADADPFYTPHANFQFKPRIRAIEIALEAEYKKPSSREKARSGALAYDVDTVTNEYWKPVMQEIEESL
jgi:glycosyltransferase involved in cell wall biosynthesis